MPRVVIVVMTTYFEFDLEEDARQPQSQHATVAKKQQSTAAAGGGLTEVLAMC